MTMRDDLAAELAACHEANEVDMPFWRAVASDVIGAGWRPRETYTTDSAEALAEAIHERFAPDHMDHWADLDDYEKRHTEAWDIAQALIASGAVRHDAEVRAEALRPIKALADEAMRRPIPGYISALQLRAALPEEGDR